MDVPKLVLLGMTAMALGPSDPPAGAGKTSIEGSYHDCSRRVELPEDQGVALEVEWKEEDRHDTQQ